MLVSDVIRASLTRLCAYVCQHVNIRNNNVDILTGLIYVDMRNKIIGRIITNDRNNSHIHINISHVDIDKFHVNINFSYTDIQVNTCVMPDTDILKQIVLCKG